jgi:hypothetical protein
MENTASSIVVFTARCITMGVIQLCLRIRCRGNVFTESLLSNGSTCHNIKTELMKLQYDYANVVLVVAVVLVLVVMVVVLSWC